jgi:iron complex outermembrane recepter protein
VAEIKPLNLNEVILAKESYMTHHVNILIFYKKKTASPPARIEKFAIITIANLIFSLIFSSHTFAQNTAPSAVTEPTLKPVIVSTPAPREQLSIGGFGDAPLREVPISATVIDNAQIKSIGAQKLADVYKFDASISDAYNAVGYIDYATVRGFVIDNKSNIRRDSLPISGDTAIGLANKDRIEILKGTSGIQAGTSAPGGLVNYVVKRPTSKPIRSVDFSVDSNGQFGAAVDLGGRFGEGNAQGYRLNVATDRLQSAAPGTRGSRQQLALALDSRVGRDGLLEAELEYSRQSQPNVPGLSLLGNAGVLPIADPKLNLNRQAWSQPTEFEGLTGSLRYSQAINDQWQWSAHLANQRLKTNDRIAFPFGCSAERVFDRFCSNGDADIYDFRSEGERRTKTALQFKIDGSLQTGSLQHNLSIGLLRSSARIQTSDQIFAPVTEGTLNLANPTQPVTANPTASPGTANTQREKTTEFFATDVIAWNERLKTWLGLRYTRLQRSDILNNSNYSRSFTTPWLAASYAISHATIYASHGQGIESDTAPTALNVANVGQVLPARRSRQSEIGIKSARQQPLSWAVTVFQIERPVNNLDACGLIGNFSCVVRPDGNAVHQGLEASAQWQTGAWQLGGSATSLRAKRVGSSEALAINGLKPTNVPSHILRLNAGYRIAPEWLISAHLSHEGRRAILPDNSLFLSAWTRLDASLKWDTQTQGVKTTWQLSVNNLAGKRFFQESPYQFGHAYLFPAAPRTLRLSASFSL